MYLRSESASRISVVENSFKNYSIKYSSPQIYFSSLMNIFYNRKMSTLQIFSKAIPTKINIYNELS